MSNILIGWNYQPGVEDKAVTNFVGLNNLGATCYQNALLQQFYNIGILYELFLRLESLET
jgi:ubiquitin C-terminal hydrolase